MQIIKSKLTKGIGVYIYIHLLQERMMCLIYLPIFVFFYVLKSLIIQISQFQIAPLHKRRQNKQKTKRIEVFVPISFQISQFLLLFGIASLNENKTNIIITLESVLVIELLTTKLFRNLIFNETKQQSI